MRLRIAMLVPGLPFDGDTVAKESLGGSESAGYYLARALADRDHDAILFTNAEAEGEWDGVSYMPASGFGAFCQAVPHDVTVVQRAPQALAVRMESRLTVLWQHDLALGRQRAEFTAGLWNVDKVALLSDFHVQQYRDVYEITDDLAWQTRNGVDAKATVRSDARDSRVLVYASRPERGLDVLLERVMPRLLERDPDYRLVICGYANVADHLRPFYDRCDVMAAALGDRVHRAGALSKDELYHLYSKSGVLVYPTPSPVMPDFAEISCITAMEARACGLPMVTTDVGALPETCHSDSSSLCSYDPEVGWDDDMVDRFVDCVWRMTEPHENDARHRLACIDYAEKDWSGVAEQWETDLIRFIEAKNDCPERLVRHFLHRSDVVAARYVAERSEGVSDASRKRIEWYDWAFDDVSRDEKYECDASLVPPVPLESMRAEPRAQAFASLVEKHDAKLVLDWGCGEGGYAIHVAERTGCEVHGYDVAPEKIARANAHETDGAAVLFSDGLPARCDYNLVWLGDILEHVPEPWAMLAEAQSYVREGGVVAFSVPYGPWESMSDDAEHLWEFEVTDLRDMIGHEPGLELRTIAHGATPNTREPIGWNVVSYRRERDVDAPRPIDLERKARFQAPRPTISANVILGGPYAVDTLHWCLRGLHPHVDEIVVGLAGFPNTDSEREVAHVLDQYPKVRTVDVPDPKESGFDEARNAVLNATTTDWIVWVDDDEKLMNGAAMLKYLRCASYDGFSIKQHHHSVDTAFPPDMPVRIFRRGTMRFIGRIHEHPEKAMNEGPGSVLIVPDVCISHVGYLTEDVRQARFRRNHPLLLKDIADYPDRLIQKHFLIRDDWLLMQDAWNRGNVESAREYAREIVRLWREHFHASMKYMNIDPLSHYSDAMRVLGEGIDVTFGITAGRDGEGGDPAEPAHVRFRDAEEAKREIDHRIDRLMSPFDVPRYW